MKVNIVLSTYNGAKFLAEQIESIQKQTFTDWQLLIRDDGSIDETPQIIKQFVAADKRIKFIIGLVQIGGMSQTMRKIDIVKNLIRQRMEGLH